MGGRRTRSRLELAKKLRKEGRRAQADEVKKLEKPTLAVWALNQLPRTQKADVERLLLAGDEIRKIQGRALAGGEARGLSEAIEEQQDAARVLVGKAQKLLGGSAGQATLDKIADALRALSVDATARTLFETGRLVREPETVGFDVFAGMPAARRRGSRRTTPTKRRDEEQARKEALRQKAAALKRELRVQEDAARDANRRAQAAEQAAEDLRKELKKLEGRA
jgi:hypothetical protein